MVEVEGGNVLAPNPKKRQERIPSIVERGRKKKSKALSTKDLPFWQNRQKLAIKKGENKVFKAVKLLAFAWFDWPCTPWFGQPSRVAPAGRAPHAQ